MSDCNRKAWLYMQPQQDWPSPVFLLRGEKASGKTHLASIWAARANAPLLQAAEVEINKPPQDYFAGGTTLVMEDIEHISHESALFHLYNYAMQQQYSLLLTMDASIVWDHFILPDLRSRLQAAPQAEITAPDDALLTALLAKHFSDRQIAWNEGLLHYLLPRLERSFAAVRQIVERLDEAALRQKQPLSISLARQILQDTSHA